ncbi:hypothetical protein JG688_00010131 [Phytophthora aleatoria]|uniref:Pectate lyase n=1 Tax=Phytophthora aleatoria TaxID=2496075 RepID=A0A8J5IS13_9STRA|nr:hypothetical protein JG688_00010131 [Phytophthora aleatoria]
MRACRVVLHASVAIALLVAQSVAQGFAIGDVPGFAIGTTGGGNATPDHPKTLDELKKLLSDDQPRVVVLDKEFNFLGTEGNTTETGCRPKSNTDCLAKNNGFKGQDVILFPSDTTLTRTGGCDQKVKVEITYDNASKNMLSVRSNKTLRGVGKKGVLKGKGLKLEGDNIIIQNVHITELNAHFLNNYIHSTSGRSPKIIGASSPSANVVAHIANNYWSDNSGHSFEPGKNAFVLAEGNFFEGTLKPMQADAEKASISVADDCRAALGRSCPGNTVEKSCKLESVNGARALETVKKYKEITGYKPGEATQLSESADNFGVGTLGDSPSQGEVNQSNEPQSEANVKQEDSAPVANGTGSQPINGTGAPRSSVQQGSE